MKKLLIVAPHLSTGGMPQYLLKIAEDKFPEYEIHVAEFNCISEDYVVQRNKIKEKYKLYQCFGDEEALKFYLKRNKPDLIYFQEIPETYLSEELVKSIYGLYETIVTTHSSLSVTGSFKNIPDKIICVNEWQKQHFTFFESKTEVWEYPIENKSAVYNTKNEYQLNLGFFAAEKHILNVGLFTPGKNQAELFMVAQENPQNCYHFVGNTAPNFEQYWGPLLKDKPENCIIWGERDDVDLFYKACDEFYFTSKFELNPICVKEALSYGLPVKMYKLETYGNFYDNNPLVTYLEGNLVKENFEKSLAIVKQEVESDSIYEKYFEVDPGDVVVDIGAHVGIFSKKAKEAGAEVYAIEPDPIFSKELRKLEGINIFPFAISKKEGSAFLKSDGNFNSLSDTEGMKVATITFKHFIEENEIEKIDFLKVDCEGGEYDIFNFENIDWIKENCNKIAGEIHIHNDEHKKKLAHLLGLLANKGIKYKFTSVDGVLVTAENLLGNLDYYTEVLFYFLCKGDFKTVVNVDFNNGVTVSIDGSDNSIYEVIFKDSDSEIIHYTTKIKCGEWARCNIEYFANWEISVFRDGKLYYQEDFSLEGENVLIDITSNSLGDNLAYIPYCEEFRKKHNCNVFVKCNISKILDYPDLNFVKSHEGKYYSSYKISWFYIGEKVNLMMHPVDFRPQPMQKTATDILGLDYVELKPALIPTSSDKKKRYF